MSKTHLGTKTTISGEEINFEIDTKKANLFSIANFFTEETIDFKEIQDELINRLRTIISDNMEHRFFPAEKPSKGQKNQFEERVGLATEIVENNLEDIIHQIFKENDDVNQKYLTWQEPRNRHNRKQHNIAVFNHRVQNYINGLVNSNRFQAVLNDYRLVNKVIDDPERFPELEELARRPIQHFMKNKRVRYMDEESQLQEARITIWSAMKNYRGENFARFSTFISNALNFKYKNLIRYHSRLKRKIAKYTYSFGSTTSSEESIFAHLADKSVYQAWIKAQRAQLNEEAKGDYDPFTTPPPTTPIELPYTQKSLGVIDKTTE